MNTFYQKFKNTSLSFKLEALYGVTLIPAGIWHELSHILAGFIVFAKLKKIDVVSFLSIKDNEFTAFNVFVKHQITANTLKMCHIKAIFIAIAPLLTLPLLIYIHPYFITYIIYAWKGFTLSKIDKELINNSIKSFKTT